MCFFAVLGALFGLLSLFNFGRRLMERVCLALLPPSIYLSLSLSLSLALSLSHTLSLSRTLSVSHFIVYSFTHRGGYSDPSPFFCCPSPSYFMYLLTHTPDIIKWEIIYQTLKNVQGECDTLKHPGGRPFHPKNATKIAPFHIFLSCPSPSHTLLHSDKNDKNLRVAITASC